LSDSASTMIDRLVEMGVNPEAAEERVRDALPRVYFGGKGPARVLDRIDLGTFYAGDWKDPTGILVSEIFYSIPDEEKLVAAKQHQEDIAKITEEKAASGKYLI
jgi:hypothetical protein